VGWECNFEKKDSDRKFELKKWGKNRWEGWIKEEERKLDREREREREREWN